MRILHIGKKECMERYTRETDFTRSVRRVSMLMGRPVREYLERMPEADVIVADAIAEVPGDLIRSMPNLKMIHSEGVAYNKIDIKAAGERGVFVCNSAGMNSQAVAEQTLLLMVGVLHDVAGNDRAVREGRQMQVKENYMSDGSLRSLSDCRVGLIGFGNIGKCTAKLLKAYGTEVFYTQRRRQDEQTEREYQVTWLEAQEELLQTCDIVSLHLPVTPETEGMCDEAFFQKMKEGSYLINTSRGELVKDEALIDALKSGRLRMAGLDTMDHEPVRKDHILLNQPEEIAGRLLFSPHIGGITGSCFRKSYQMIWDNIRRVAEGKVPENVVNGGFFPNGTLFEK